MNGKTRTVYLETTIVSYYVARPSRDLITAARQELTREWWESERHRYSLAVSPTVVGECAAGDTEAAQRRLDLLAGIRVLEPDKGVDELGEQIRIALRIPVVKRLDARHLSYAIRYRMGFLLTWNCTHLAHPQVERALGEFCRKHDLWCPLVCTPEHLLTGRER